jgi:hypothetical protein
MVNPGILDFFSCTSLLLSLSRRKPLLPFEARPGEKWTAQEAGTLPEMLGQMIPNAKRKGFDWKKFTVQGGNHPVLTKIYNHVNFTSEKQRNKQL